MTAVVDRNRLLKSAAGFALAAFAIYLFGRALGWEALLGALARADPAWVVAASASAALCLCLCVWTLSWRHVLSTVGVGIPWRSLVVNYFAATFVNYVTPLGRTSGAPVSAYILSTDHRAPYDESLATVATVTTLNLAPMLTFAGLGALTVAGGDVPGRMTPVLAGVGGLCVAAPMVTLGTWRVRDHVVDGITAAGWVSVRTGLVDPDDIDRRVRGFFTILDRVGRSRWELLEVLTLSYVGWVLFAAPLWLSAKALGVHLDPLLVAFVVPASTLASVVPTPGGIGGVETAIVLLLTGLGGVPAATAGAIALLYRVAGYWFVVTLGGLAVLSVSTR
jgi:uncharacterized protein (TIRG00374 family)